MFSRVLVPVDFTANSRRALQAGAELVAPSGKLVAIHVIETIDAPFEELEDFYRKLETQATESMHELAGGVELGGATFEERICFGKRVVEIVKYAREGTADLIIVGSHQLDPDDLERTWMTLSHQITILAPCPVLVLK